MSYAPCAIALRARRPADWRTRTQTAPSAFAAGGQLNFVAQQSLRMNGRPSLESTGHDLADASIIPDHRRQGRDGISRQPFHRCARDFHGVRSGDVGCCFYSIRSIVSSFH